MDIRRRIDHLVARVDRRHDYGQLLAHGQVIHRLEEVDDIDAWRAEIKRQARADKIKVRTGFNDGIVWALRFRPDQPGGQAEVQRYRGGHGRGRTVRRRVPHEEPPSLTALAIMHVPEVTLA